MSPRALNLLAVLAMLAALAGVVAIAIWSQASTFLDEPGPSVAESVVVLPRGAGLDEITAQLNAAGVIDRPWLFRLAVRLQGQDRALKAGEYAFPAHATPASVINMLARGDTVARRLTVAEGLTVAEVFRLLAETEGLSGELPEPPPEGTLLPETYFYARGDERAELVRRMRHGMDALLDKLWPTRDPTLPLADRHEALVLASIVDKETGTADERSTVAAVFVNRLRKGMRLQSDPTVIYGLTGGQGALDRPLTRNDWQHDSPYNTYRIDGLPPTPIGNPGRAALEAVLAPADVDYLYFVADGTGGHAFGRTLEEHNRNVAKWQQIKNGRQSGPVTPSPVKPDPAG
jgi:peptidoglycan lytic transglycosylase G